MTQPDREAAGFWDASLWEEAKKQGDEAIRRMINRCLDNTSVTAVLIGAETAGREWVKYEIKRSVERGNGLLGIFIDGIKDRYGRPDQRGENPFGGFYFDRNGRRVYLSEIYPTYDWVQHDGYNGLADWVEAAAQAAGR